MRDPFEFQTRVCSNGVRLYIQERPAPIQSSTLFFRAGSRYDPIPGTAHFLEHVVSEETEQFSSWDELDEYADDLSLDVAWGTTSTEIMYWKVTALPERMEAAVDLLREIIFASTLTPRAVEHEREVITREIRREKTPEAWRVFQEGARRFFPVTHPLAERSHPLGSEETVARISRDELLAFRQTFFGTENMTIVTAGPLPTNDVQRVVEKVFSGAARGQRQSVASPWLPRDLPEIKAGAIHLDYHELFGAGKDREETYSLCGFAPCGEYDLASTLLLRTLRRLLAYELRNVRRLTYSVGRQTRTYPEVIWWSFSTQCPAGKANEIAQAVAQAIRAPTLELRDRFDRVKRCAMDNFAMREWATRYIVDDALGDLADLDRIELEAETRAKYESVTFDDIAQLLPHVQPERTVRIYGCYGKVSEAS